MRVYGLIGKTLSHSFSQTYFEDKFSSEQLEDCSYQNFELQSIDELPEIIKSTPSLRGLNITIPYKEEVLRYLDQVTDDVKKIGACNCIKVQQDGTLKGYNTDAFGFRRSLENQVSSLPAKAIILGSGGASKAIRYALNQMNIPSILVSRSGATGSFSYGALDEEMIRQHQLIINTTPVGMFPDVTDKPAIPYEYISSAHILFDLIYNPSRTEFLMEGERRNATIINGYEMLVLQAEESWRIWNAAGE